MDKRKLILVSWVSVLVVGLAVGVITEGCGDGSNGSPPPPPPTGTATATDTVSWTNDVYPYLTTSCRTGDCHGQASQMDLSLPIATVYSIVRTNVDTNNPGNSKLLKKGLGQDDHGGGVIFSGTADPDYQMIQRWIGDGAKNN